MRYEMPPGHFPPVMNLPTDPEFTTIRGYHGDATEAWDTARQFGDPTWHIDEVGHLHKVAVDVVLDSRPGQETESVQMISSQDHGPAWKVLDRWNREDATRQYRAQGGPRALLRAWDAYWVSCQGRGDLGV